jgi:hypothetical protein
MDQDRSWEDLEKKNQDSCPKIPELSDSVHPGEMENFLRVKEQNFNVMKKSAELLKDLRARN